MKGKPNVWGEDESKHYHLLGRPDIAKHLVTGLLEHDVDIAYAYKPLHQGPNMGEFERTEWPMIVPPNEALEALQRTL